MRPRQRHLKSSPRGFTIMEVSLALAVLLAAAILLTQFLVASSHQSKLADQRRLALEELSNRLERVQASKWENLNAAEIEKQDPSAEVKSRLPAANITAAITDEPGPLGGKRVRLAITWEQNGARVSPLELTGWKYPPAEVRP